MDTPRETDDRTPLADARSGRIRISRRQGEYCLVAAEPIEAGEQVMRLDGVPSPVPTRESVQIGASLHIAMPEGFAAEDPRTRYLWRFLNHSCRPTVRVVGDAVVAITRIDTDQEVAFDYNANEYDMATPFLCRCGHCDGIEVRGFRHLDEEGRERRAGQLSEHLLEIAGEALEIA